MKTLTGLPVSALSGRRGLARWHLCGLALAWSLTAVSAAHAADSARAASAEAPRSASQVGSVVPGAGVISAAVSIVAVSGGEVKTVPLAADGSFSFSGLAPGRYKLTLATPTVSRQTQGATFGEKVSAGLQAAGGAIAQGSAATQAGNAVPNARMGDINGGMPNRISMNVTTPRQNLQVQVNGDPVEVDVAADGLFSGSATAVK